MVEMTHVYQRRVERVLAFVSDEQEGAPPVAGGAEEIPRERLRFGVRAARGNAPHGRVHLVDSGPPEV